MYALHCSISTCRIAMIVKFSLSPIHLPTIETILVAKYYVSAVGCIFFAELNYVKFLKLAHSEN